MKCFVSFVICLALALPALAQTAATQPLGGSTNPLLGKLFRSRIDGIQFNPPAGGGMIRELNSGDIVRFVYADDNWDVRVKPVQLHVPLALSAPPDAGLLELTASHLTDSNPSAVILRKEVMAIHGNNVGRIEATYNAGTDRIFAQQALFKDFKDTGERYFSVQMTSKDPAKDDARARTAFEAMLDSVQILDRQELAKEQERRLLKTRGLWVLLDRKTISAALQPLHFMRVVRDGRDVGFIQINERLAKHNGNDGVEVIIHSRVQPDQQTDTSSPAPVGPAAAAGTNGIVIPKPLSPSIAPATRPAGPQNLYTYSSYFVTFDRDHEDWTTIIQTDDDVANQLTESAYSDRTTLRKLDRARLRQKQQPATRAATTREMQGNSDRASSKPDVNEPPMIQVPKYVLDVDYQLGRRQEASKDTDLPPFYLPQALGQLLPRLLPPDHAQYMFAFYVSSQRNVMSRYVDVESAREVELDGQTVRAVPITDRIGADGISTTHYVTRQGEWLGSISEDYRLQVFPTDEHTLKGLWPGFATSPEPPLDGDAVPGVSPPDSYDFKVQNPGSGGR